MDENVSILSIKAIPLSRIGAGEHGDDLGDMFIGDSYPVKLQLFFVEPYGYLLQGRFSPSYLPSFFGHTSHPASGGMVR